MSFWIGWWGASTPPELVVGFLIFIALGLILSYAIVRKGKEKN